MRVGYWEILIIVGVIALRFGARKIPDIARSIGRAKGEFKKGLAEGDAPDSAEKKEIAEAK